MRELKKYGYFNTKIRKKLACMVQIINTQSKTDNQCVQT